MSNLDYKFYFVTFNEFAKYGKAYYRDILYQNSGPKARMYLDTVRYFGANRLFARNGKWDIPWDIQIMPGLEMPKYESNFKNSFAEVTDQRALEIKKMIHETGAKIAVYYSGGIDSLVCVVALLKNLTAKELQHVSIGLSSESIIENPDFFNRHILKKNLNFFDSAKVRYSDLMEPNRYIISSDTGDSIFGTEYGTGFYYMFNELLQQVSPSSKRNLEGLHSKIAHADTHFSVFADMLIAYFDLPEVPSFGKAFYEKMVENINSATVPVHTVHDFFWWWIFNLKFCECAVRGALYYSSQKNCKSFLEETYINWFSSQQYQLWSMNNNNNGQKIKGVSAATYKWVAREYIYSYDQNEWYLRHKLKISSLKNIIQRNESKIQRIFGISTNYDIYTYDKPELRDFISQRLSSYG